MDGPLEVELEALALVIVDHLLVDVLILFDGTHFINFHFFYREYGFYIFLIK